MLKEKLYDICWIDIVDFDYNLFDMKEKLTELLNASTPVCVEKFDSTGTRWDLKGEYYNSLELKINGGELNTSDLVGGSIDTFCEFMLQFAYHKDKVLICPFDYESCFTVLVSTPMENNMVRISVLNHGTLYYKETLPLQADILIKKDTFISQISDLFKKMSEDETNCYSVLFEQTASELDNYLKAPKKFRENFEPKRHIRIIDVAYKKPDSDWEFSVCTENDEKAHIEYWDNLKSKGEITDYDYEEQYPKPLFRWKKRGNGYKKISQKEIQKDLKPDMEDRVRDKNWVYSAATKKWYSTNEIMPEPKQVLNVIHNRLSYEIEFDKESYPNDEVNKLEHFVRDSYDVNGEWIGDGYLDCTLIIKDDHCTAFQMKFSLCNTDNVRKSLKKVEAGKDVRFDLRRNANKLHIWHNKYSNKDRYYLSIACYKNSDDDDTENSRLFYGLVDKNEFLKCFNNALDEINHKIEVIKHVFKVGKELDIDKKFRLNKNHYEKFEHIAGFKGDYACVYKSSLEGAGIINKQFEWVIQPKYSIITGKTDPKFGAEFLGAVRKYRWIENVDGNFFIATKDDFKKFVMDINGDIKIPHVSDEIYYTYMNNELYFFAVDYNKTYVVNSKGEDVLTLDFPIGEKFWLFEDIFIASKDEKFGIINFKGKNKGKVLIDFIFTDISPDKDNLDFIPVKYLELWGVVNSRGKVLNIDFKEKADYKNKLKR